MMDRLPAWVPARLIAAAKLPGVPTSRFRVRVYGSAHKWKMRTRNGRGGTRWEFAVESLSEDQRAALRSKLDESSRNDGKNTRTPATAGVIGQASEAEVEAAWRRFERLSGRAKERAERALQAWEIKTKCQARDLSRGAARRTAELETGLHRAAINNACAVAERFRGQPRQVVLGALAPKWGDSERRTFVKSVPGLSEFLAGLVIERKNVLPVAAAARTAIAHFRLEKQHAVAIKRWIEKFCEQNRSELLIACRPDAAMSSLLPAHGDAAAGAGGFLGVVELDGSPSDAATVETLSGRRTLLVLIDVATRATVAIVADSENGDAVARLVAKFHTKYGLPRVIRTDHGRAFSSARVRNFIERLGICLEHVRPYAGWLKPFAEGSAIAGIQRFLKLERGYVGRNPVERQQLRGRLSRAARRGLSEGQILQIQLTDRQLEAHIDQYLEAEAARSRPELGGKSTNQLITDYLARGGVIRRIEDAAALSALLAPAGVITVGKKGVRVGGQTYIAAGLGGIVGHRVEFREHADADKLVIYTAEREPRFVCIAVNRDSLSDAERQAEAIAARTAFRVRAQAIRKVAHKLTKKLPGSPAEMLLSASTTLPNGEIKVVTVPFAPPALVESGKAARAKISQRELTAQAARESDAAEAKWLRFQRLREVPAENLSTEDVLFLRIYPATFEYAVRAGRERGVA